ncbi:hypothetical protein AAY473_008070, partial [Plecturocebus cupreus]
MAPYPESVEGQLILKNKFIAQAAPSIRRKLQKQAIGPDSTLREPPEDQEEDQEKERKQQIRIEAVFRIPEVHLLVAFSVANEGTLRRESSGSKKKPPRPGPACRGTTENWTAPGDE